MASPRQKNLVDRRADVGEEAIQRLGSAPGADKLVGTLNGVRDRVEDLQKRVRGLEGLEKRLSTLERRLDKLEGKGKSTSSSRRRSTSSSTTRKKSSSSS
jgi:hypothetical protein